MSDAPTITAPPVADAPPVNTSPYYADLFKSDGSMNHAALDRLPEDVRYLKDSFTKYPKADDFFRGIANQQTLAGKKGLLPLPANAPPEAIADRKALLDSIHGVPKEAKDYQIKMPQGFNEKFWDKDLVSGFSAWAHENSINPAAAQKLVEMQMGRVQSQIAAQQQYETEFFANHDKAFNEAIRQQNIPRDQADSLVERAAIALGLDPANPEDAVMLKNSKVRLAMMKHAQATGEDTFSKGSSSGGGGDAMAQANDIMHNKLNPLYEPLYNTSHPQHKMANAKLDELTRLAAAQKK